MRRNCTCLLIAAAASLLTAKSAVAFPNFWKLFEAEYIEGHENQEWVAEIKAERFQECFMCHQGKKRKNHNVFGTKFKELVDKKDNRALSGQRRDPEGYEAAKTKVLAALVKVLAMPVDPNQPDGETYGDRIEAGKWPGGALAELKEEPPAE